jgi:hypothetical protein
MTLLTDYGGRRVRLTEERMAHILAHREMAGLDEAINQTLRRPERVVQSRTDSTVELCYRRQLTAIFGDKWLCVVVKYEEGDAFLLTAYLTDKIKSGAVLWPKQ